MRLNKMQSSCIYACSADTLDHVIDHDAFEMQLLATDAPRCDEMHACEELMKPDTLDMHSENAL